MNSKEIMEQLKKPFKASEIEWRVGSTNKEKTKGLALAYVTNRAIQNRLDEVFGPFGWQNEFKEWKGNSQICGISVYDEDKNQWITKWDGADDSQTEAIKGGLSDSMKRAACQWGIGRYLYELPDQWFPLKDGKYLDGTPKLPDWALPEPKGMTNLKKTNETIEEITTKYITVKQAKELVSLVEETKQDMNYILNYYGVSDFTFFNEEQYKKLKDHLNKKKTA